VNLYAEGKVLNILNCVLILSVVGDNNDKHRESREKSLPKDNGQKLSIHNLSAWQIRENNISDSRILDSPKAAWTITKSSSKEDGSLQWKYNTAEYRLSLPIDFLCPYCNVLTHSDKTGTFRCSSCGRTPS